MIDPINVFYYPDCLADQTTFKKAILFFDEIHFMDRPSFGFRGGFGSVGMESPLRPWERKFREDGVPLYVHEAPGGGGLVEGDLLTDVTADINDPEFLRRYQRGLVQSSTFRNLQLVLGNYVEGRNYWQIVAGNYGEGRNNLDVTAALESLNLPEALRSYDSPMALLEDQQIRPFELGAPISCAKTIVANAAIYSAKLNVALSLGTANGFIPLADARPFGDLLGAKYARAIGKLSSADNRVQVTDLTFSIFDELVSGERLAAMEMRDVIRYRKASDGHRREFLEHLSILQAKQSGIGSDGDYAGAVEKIVKTEILPAARTFKNKLRAIDETFSASLTKGAVGALGGSVAVNFFGDLSWQRLVALAGVAGVYVINAAIDAIVAKRAAKRECAISYVLSLDA